MDEKQIRKVRELIFDYQYALQRCLKNNLPFDLEITKKYEKALMALGISSPLAHVLLTETEKKVESQWYGFMKEYEVVPVARVKDIVDWQKTKEKAAMAWSKIFAFNVKNEKTDYGAVLDYQKVHSILLKGETIDGSSREESIMACIRCDEDVAGLIVAKYDESVVESYYSRIDESILKQIDGLQDIKEISDVLAKAGIIEAIQAEDKYLTPIEIADYIVDIRGREMFYEVESYSPQSSKTLEL